MRSLTANEKLLVVLTVSALLWRGLFFPVTQGAYTDGILQIDAFRQGLTFWPPLYGLLSRLFVWLPGVGLEGSARIVSWLAGAAVVPVLFAMALRLFGRRAAIYAAVVWLVSPMALRWSVQVMTDMTATALWSAALGALLLAYEQALPELFPSPPRGAPSPRRTFEWLLIGSLLGTLATLTRYQGILLLPPMALASAHLDRVLRHRNPSGTERRTWWGLLPWVAVPLWLLRQGPGPLENHFRQIGERGSQLDFFQTLYGVYWLQFEEFLRALPVFLTLGITGFLLYGLLRTRWETARLRWFGWLALYLMLAILALQSVFSSFQARYLLPLLPLVCLFAGHGFATLDRHVKRRPVYWAVAGAALGYSLLMALLVGVWQGSPFLDLKQAALYINAQEDLRADARVYTNELYNADIQGAKLRFWLNDREVYLEPATAALMQGSLRDNPPPREGDLLVLSSAYGGGIAPYRSLIENLQQQGMARVRRRFPHRLIPFLPDIMAEPGTHQNPLALVLRYRMQVFETTVMEITAAPQRRLENPPAPPLPEPQLPGPNRETLQRIESLSREIDALRGAADRPGTATEPGS
ncbi:MAG TPA: glycosyltransferase family 39 protein [Candidatus Sumerlaeota bacterium]|mgnify:FL=1|nr:MAG: Alg9-like mannosyltransferase family protein [candidate division BRC1 bacterium ADurb.BinA292]HOE95920.1 glycosyltransferase family 39 protein [Candidatus Sumerlaeota bacterium]HPK02260.1 glycosyltransferase family 39 protein [Candidatus Sumerlaeota bacterium]